MTLLLPLQRPLTENFKRRLACYLLIIPFNSPLCGVGAEPSIRLLRRAMKIAPQRTPDIGHRTPEHCSALGRQFIIYLRFCRSRWLHFFSFVTLDSWSFEIGSLVRGEDVSNPRGGVPFINLLAEPQIAMTLSNTELFSGTGIALFKYLKG